MQFRGLVAAVAVAVACSVSHGALAAAPTITDLPVKLGDSVEDVKRALGTTLEPEPMESAVPNMPGRPKKFQLRLKTRGIWVFFEKDRVVTYRIDAPFRGTVGGVKIGDDISKLRKLLGEPVKVNNFAGRTRYTYYFDDETTTNIVMSDDDAVETIFFIK